MEISVEYIQADPSVTIMKLKGELDASSYLEVIDKAKALHQAGTRRMLLDLSEMAFMSSSGLVALHSIALLMRGETPPDVQAPGWHVMHQIANRVEQAGGYEAHLKLLEPQPTVAKTLKLTGFERILQVFSNREEALASF